MGSPLRLLPGLLAAHRPNPHPVACARSFDGHSDHVTDAAAVAIAEALPDSSVNTICVKTRKFGADESITGNWGNDDEAPSGGKGALWQAFKAKHGDEAQLVVIPRVCVALAVDKEFVTFMAALDATMDEDYTAWKTMDQMVEVLDDGGCPGGEKRLDFDVPGFTDAHVTAIAEVLTNSSAEILVFSNEQKFTDAAAFAIAKALREDQDHFVKRIIFNIMDSGACDIFTGNWGNDGDEPSGGKGALWQALQEKFGDEAQVEEMEEMFLIVGSMKEESAAEPPAAPAVEDEEEGEEDVADEEEGEQEDIEEGAEGSGEGDDY